LPLVFWLSGAKVKKWHALKVGESARELSAKPKLPMPRSTLHLNIELEFAAVNLRADFILWLKAHEPREQMPGKQPVPTQPQARALNYANFIVWRWGRGMLGMQRASPDIGNAC
jgi:hypothetical protein